MADFVGFFQILNPDQQDWDGRYTANAADELRNGILVKRNSGDTLSPTGAGDTAVGFVMDNRNHVYSPTTVYAAAGEMVTLVHGAVVRFAADLYSFAAGALPVFGDNLYTGANGLIAVNSGAAAAYIGKCIGTDDIRIAPNSTRNVVICEAKFLV